jgi:hypothetical protein
MMAEAGDVGIISNGSLFNFDCDSLTGWTQQNVGNGLVSAETLDGETVFRFYDTGQSSSNVARVFKGNNYTSPNFFVYSEIVKYTKLNTRAEANVNGSIDIRIGPTGEIRSLFAIYSDYFRSQAGAGNIDTPFNFPIDQYVTITIAFTWSDIGPTVSADLYIDNIEIATGIDAYRSVAATSDGYLGPGYVERELVTERGERHLNRIIIGDGFA